MRDLVVLFIHFIATLARLLRPGGARSIVAESLLLNRVGPDPCRLAGAVAASHSPAPVCHCAEALNPAGPSTSHVRAKIPHAVLTQSQSQARPEGTECRTRPCDRRNEATQSPLVVRESLNRSPWPSTLQSTKTWFE